MWAIHFYFASVEMRSPFITVYISHLAVNRSLSLRARKHFFKEANLAVDERAYAQMLNAWCEGKLGTCSGWLRYAYDKTDLHIIQNYEIIDGVVKVGLRAVPNVADGGGGDGGKSRTPKIKKPIAIAFLSFQLKIDDLVMHSSLGCYAFCVVLQQNDYHFESRDNDAIHRLPWERSRRHLAIRLFCLSARCNLWFCCWKQSGWQNEWKQQHLLLPPIWLPSFFFFDVHRDKHPLKYGLAHLHWNFNIVLQT